VPVPDGGVLTAPRLPPDLIKIREKGGLRTA